MNAKKESFAAHPDGGVGLPLFQDDPEEDELEEEEEEPDKEDEEVLEEDEGL